MITTAPTTKKGPAMLAACLLAVFLLALSLRLHGYSLPEWHRYLDNSPQTEVVWGHTHDIRADDWLAEIPLILAQTSHVPSFPVINTNIGLGQNMLIPMKVPSRHWITIFRPTTWGFFLSPAFGISWMWGTLALGLFYSIFLVFLSLSREKFWLSLMSTTLVFFSSFFQNWSFHKGEIVIHAMLMLVALFTILKSQKRSFIVLSGVLFVWSAVGFVLDYIYPPFQVPLLYLVIFSCFGFFFSRKLYRDETFPYRLGLIFLATLITGLIGLCFFREAKTVIDLITNTSYPGRRVSLGGDRPWWFLFSGNLHLEGRLAPLINICETSDFVLWFPAVTMTLLVSSLREKKWPEATVGWLVAYIAIIIVYCYVGFSPLLAKASLFANAWAGRTSVGLGIADAALVLTFFVSKRFSTLPRRFAYPIAFLFAWLIFYDGFCAREKVEQIKYATIIVGAILNGVFAYGLIRRELWFFPVLALITILHGYRFNPVVKDGTAFLYDNPLSQRVLEIHRAQKTPKKWIVMGSGPNIAPIYTMTVSNLLRTIGVPSLGGYHTHPQPEIWRALDPKGELASLTNQSAYVNFRVGNEPRLRAKIVSAGNFEAFVDPTSPALPKLGVGYFLIAGPPSVAFNDTRKFRKLAVIGDKTIYELIE